MFLVGLGYLIYLMRIVGCSYWCCLGVVGFRCFVVCWVVTGCCVVCFVTGSWVVLRVVCLDLVNLGSAVGVCFMFQLDWHCGGYCCGGWVALWLF